MMRAKLWGLVAFGVIAISPTIAAQGISRRDSATKAFASGFMALNSAGVKRFATDHPLWDGRGVLIAIMDSGIDPGIAGLGTTSDGAPKIMDLRDFSGEGKIRLQRATRRGDTLFVGDRHVVGAAHVASLAGDAQVWGGVLSELSLGKAPAADINGNGTVGDTLLVIVTKVASGWILLTDTNGDGSLADERPIHDFLVAHESFGWNVGAARPGATRNPPVNIAVNLADSAGAPKVDLFFDTSSHGSHVSGIASGHNIYGVAGFDGVAPGAKLIGLKIANDAAGGVSVTGSMVRALDYAIRFASEHSMPLVVNLSFGVGNEIEGTVRIDAMIDSILAAHPGVAMTIAAGNDGPGLSSLGFPASAARVISVGATLPAVFSGANVNDTITEPIAPFSSGGGEIAAPDIVVPGAAYSTVPAYAVGDELENGTSMAAPYAAGLIARLLSGAKASGLETDAVVLRQALRAGAHRLPSGSAIDQGAGLPDLTRSWAWLAGRHEFPHLAVDVGQVTGRGAVFLTANPAGGPQRALGTRVQLRRIDGTAPLTVRLSSDAPWVQLPEAVTLTNGRGEFTVSVPVASIAGSGVMRASIRVQGSDDAAGPLVEIPVTVRVPIPVSGTATAVRDPRKRWWHRPRLRSRRQRPRHADRDRDAASG